MIPFQGKAEHVTARLHAACGLRPPSEKSQNLYKNLQVPPPFGRSLLSFLAAFPSAHCALATLASELAPKQAGRLLPQGLCTGSPARSAPLRPPARSAALSPSARCSVVTPQGGPP